MKRNLLISAVVVVGLIGGSTVSADLILTIDGQNPTGVPLMLEGIGPYVIALDGNTPLEPNDIRIESIGGMLSTIPDVNHQYIFQYESESTAGFVHIITNTDVTMDGVFIPAETTIYELFIFCNPDVNLTGACGSDYSVLFPPEEEGEGDQGESFADGTGESLDVSEGQGAPDFETGEFGGGETMLDNIIEITDDITTNQIWTEGNTYHITTDIDIQALLVIEPGTIVGFAADTGMFINNGGTLISAGTPDEPIIYTSDSATPDFGDYYCPLYIEETASASTKVTYCYIEYAYIGLWTLNKRLDSPIENNYFFYNTYGIVESGTDLTDIKNNLLYYSDLAAIDVNFVSETGQADSDSRILIQNNTCDSWQSYGIIVWGVANPGDAGRVELVNNIVSRSYYYGIALVNGYMYYTVKNTGYYDNAVDKYWDFEEYNPVVETVMPYVTGTGILPDFYLRQDCNFVNAGAKFIEQTSLIGKTTTINSFPDSNYTDIGFHYPNWRFSNVGDGNGLTMDLYADSFVDFKDYVIFASGWQTDYNVYDLNTMADEWLKNGNPPIAVTISGDPNNGYVEIGVTGYSSDTRRVFLLADGKYVGEIFRFEDGYTLTTDISDSDGSMDLKLIGVDNTGRLICSEVNEAMFPSTLNYCVLPEIYVKNQPLPFAAFNSGVGDITVKVYANGGILVWSQTFSGNSILGSIPAEITNQYAFDYVSFDNSSGQSLAVKVTESQEYPWRNAKALIILPDRGIRFRDYRTIATVKDAFKRRGVAYYVLRGPVATYDEIAWFKWNGINIKYMFIDAHGHYKLRKYDGSWVLRTVIKLYDGPVVSIKQTDFSDPNSAPSWCEDLEVWEFFTKSFYSIGFTSLEFVYSMSCYGGHLKINANNELVEGQPGQQGLFDIPHSDMSIALGMSGSGRSNFYQGWYNEPWSNVLWNTGFQEWTQLEWEELGNGENLYWALYNVIMQQTDFGPDAPVNNYRLKGEGYMDEIVLSN